MPSRSRVNKPFLLTGKYFLALLMCALITSGVMSQQKMESSLLDSIFYANANKYPEIAANPDAFRVQLIYTQINRTEDQFPVLKHHFYHLDTLSYFYPASMVKLPLAAIAIEKLNLMGIQGVNKFTCLSNDPGDGCLSAASKDPSCYKGCPSIGHYIKKLFLVSDNDAYNKLFEFVGQKHLNDRLFNMGFPNTRIIQKFANCDTEGNRYSSPVSFYNSKGARLFTQEGAYNPDHYSCPIDESTVGKNHYSDQDGVLPGPMDFSRSNFISLWSLHRILISLMMPAAAGENERFILKPEDYDFLRMFMSMIPREASDPVYPASKYYDGYVKYLYSGRSKETFPESLRIFNKVGMSYGFLSDAAYFVDFNTGTEFFLSAVIYVNKNDVVGDGRYEYSSVGLPFLRDIGRAILSFEQKRNPRIKPDLEHLKFNWK